MGIAFLELLFRDLVFVVICVLVVLPLVTHKRAAWAVLRRNFVGYFSNPTGYVFLCLFVLLTSFAAFWPHEFFTANLANLDQLNRYLPYIMLVFIPAITMSIWSEERRQGTDELLLTLPADDFDIVIGKYLAAGAIFTTSLVFSQVCNFLVLASLTVGDLDVGLFFATYFGYWLMGLAMLSIGMVASFLTSNVTVGFILGAAFNAPLAFAARADVIVGDSAVSRLVSFWSYTHHFDDLGRGVISLVSVAFFVLVGVVSLYISMVLIGTRHWTGRGGPWMFLHYVLRTAALVGTLVALTLFFTDHNLLRVDSTAGEVSSLSPKTKEIVRTLQSEHPIVIDAFVSKQVPESYVQTKYNLLSLLKEFDALSGGKIRVRLHNDLEPFSDEAALAEERFGIQPTMVRTRDRGAFKDEEVILGAAFSSGLEKVVVPFFDYGIPVEYELTRSIGTVAQGERKKVGILRTDAQLYGGFSMAGGMPQQIPKQEIVVELEKQYDVEEVDPTNPIEVGKYDVLIVVQPSSLGEPEMQNLIAAVEAGQPMAMFEDPSPIFFQGTPGTGEPKQSPGGMFGGGQPMPKGNIRNLWTLLGIDPPGEPSMQGGFNPDIAWQQYNPYPKLQIEGIPDAWVFASNDAPGAENALNQENGVTAGLSEVLFPVPGAIALATNSDLKFTPLAKTSSDAGTIRYEKYRQNANEPSRLKAAQGRPKGEQVLAALIESPPSTKTDDSDKQASAAKSSDAKAADAKAADAKSSDEKARDAKAADQSDSADPSAAKPAAQPGLKVIYVADIDLLSWQFLRLRARPEEDSEIDWRFENVNFLLNIVDVLAEDDRYVEIRRRKPFHATLKRVEEQIREQRDKEFADRITFENKFKEEVDKIEEKNREAVKEFQKRLDDLKNKQSSADGGDVNLADIQGASQELAIKQRELEKQLEVARERLGRERDRNVKLAQRQTDLRIREIQNFYKFLAVALPPIPPLLIGLIVFVTRRLREREGIAKSRLRV